VPDAETAGVGPKVSAANTIVFNRTICTVNNETGVCSLTEQKQTENGLLNEETLFLSVADRGKTKDVYGVRTMVYPCHVTHV
jgi:hypothetical protein